MDLPIVVFEIMAAIAKENKITGTKWARASGVSPSRISDFKRLAKQTNAGEAEPVGEREVTGYIFSLNHFFTLWDGLRRLVGASALRKGLISQLQGQKTPSTRVRISLRLMAFNDGQLKLVDAFTDAVLQQVRISTKRNYS
jgi:hypothetical protein